MVKKIWNKFIFILTLVMINSNQVLAAYSDTSGGIRLIQLLQKASFWVGMGVTIWGIVEAQLDFPGWKGRVLKGVLGYVAILLIPLVFFELKNALELDPEAWRIITGGK